MRFWGLLLAVTIALVAQTRLSLNQLQTGAQAGYLKTNGTVNFWGDVTTGGSGALDCVSVPGQCDIVPAVVPLKGSANTWTGLNDFSGALLTLPPGAGSMPVYGQTGPVSSPHVTAFWATASDYTDEWSYPLAGGAQFTNQPMCSVSGVTNASSANSASYCTATGAHSVCAHASTGSTIWLHGSLSPGNDFVLVSCVGN